MRSVEAAFILQALQLLNPDGYAIFIIPEGLLFNESNRVFREYIIGKYSLQAVISLPINSFQPYSGIKTSILILRNSKQAEKVFFAEFAEAQALKAIVANFQKHVSNKNLSQGFWVDYDGFKKLMPYGLIGTKAAKDYGTKKASSEHQLNFFQNWFLLEKVIRIPLKLFSFNE